MSSPSNTVARVDIHERPFNMLMNALFWVIWTIAFYFILQVWYIERSDEVAMIAFFYAAAWVAATYVFARYILMRQPVVTIDDTGLYDRRVFMRPVPWSDIVEIRVRRGSLQVSVKEPFKYRRVAATLSTFIPPLRRWFATGRANILFRGLNSSKDDITAAVKAHKSVTA